MTQSSEEGDFAGLSASDGEVIAIAQRAVVRSEAGLDEPALALIHAALRAVVPFDYASLLALDERSGLYRVLWRYGDPKAPGILFPSEPQIGKREGASLETPIVAETVSPTG